ncbi:hypothetical protein ACJJIC_14685 [Microbulbifer sp. ANSA002]|uniref:hypothetical protein n=1 Tax=unclassified Microbulbifer TaxID=2619833 RepID=UPI004042EB9E
MSKEENKSIWRHIPLWIVLILGGLTTFVLVVIIGNSLSGPEYKECWSVQCVSNFFTYFNPAIKTLAGTLTAAGIVTLLFRINQTYRQIEHEHKKTAFSQYIEHRKLFDATLERLEEDKEIEFEDKNSIYNHWFPNVEITKFDISLSGEGPIMACLERLKQLESELNEIHKNFIFSDTQLEQLYLLLNLAFCNLSIKKIDWIEDSLFHEVNFHKLAKMLSAVINEVIKLSDSKDYAPSFTSERNKIFDLASTYLEREKEEKVRRITQSYVFTFGLHSSRHKTYIYSEYYSRAHLLDTTDSVKFPTLKLRNELEFEESDPTMSEEFINVPTKQKS